MEKRERVASQIGRCARRGLVAGALSVAFGLSLYSPAAEAAGCPDEWTLPILTTIPKFNAATVCLLNQDRAASGLAPLAENSRLDSSALIHSSEMRQYSYFAHESPDGSPFSARIANSGYLAGASRWTIGENIAWGSLILGTPNAINTAWMNSPHHRDNILDPDYREIGIGSISGSPRDPNELGAIIVTHDFGRVDRDPAQGGGKARAAKKKKKKAKRLRNSRKKRLAGRRG
jgi:uncharacterized protein YkwD